jgi:hypothetical protein
MKPYFRRGEKMEMEIWKKTEKKFLWRRAASD